VKDSEIEQYLLDMPDEVMSHIQFAAPWQFDTSEDGYVGKDVDGFPEKPYGAMSKEDSGHTREILQGICWDKFHRNPHVNTSVRGTVGRLTGFGFGVSSGIQEIHREIQQMEKDWRNRLYHYWPKYTTRAYLEGELFLVLSVHEDGFIEVDFMDPGLIHKGGDDDTGIIFHPNKAEFPLFYNISGDVFSKSGGSDEITDQIPSIYVAKYPDLINVAKKHKDYKRKYQQNVRSRRKIYKNIGGYTRFMVNWNRGLVTRRSVSYIRTVIEWINHYENLKKYEIDHKKSSGSYLWIMTIDNPRDFKLWLGLSDEDRKKTGIMAKKTPGSTLVLPPGMTIDCVNPKLPTITGEDIDIREMVGAGLNEAEDVMTGSSSRGNFSSVKATRGPMSDRISDEVSAFDKWLKYDFWASVFFLKSAIGKFKSHFSINEAVDFDDKKDPVMKKVKYRPEELIDISYPVSETIDFEARARALLGVKHGPVAEQLGMSNSEVANKMGTSGYGRMRLDKATEDEKYPELAYETGVDAEGFQEKVEGEPTKVPAKKEKPTPKPKQGSK